MTKWQAFVPLLAAACGTLCAPRLSAATPNAADFDPARLEREVLASGLHDVIQLSLAPNGDVFFIERAGALKRFSAVDRAVRTVGKIDVIVGGEYGLIGLALAPDFAHTRQLYVLFAPRAGQGKGMRLARFTLRPEGDLDPASETPVLGYTIRGVGHQGGSLQFDADGNLWLSTGDDTPAGAAPSTDERPGREGVNALRTAANSQDLRGKILRLRPRPAGGYEIPAGNLFTDPQQGRPEIYVMGCRNPYRFHYDSRQRQLYWGEVGANTELRFGHGGFDEFSRTAAPGNSGWPHFVGPNLPYRRFDPTTNTVGDFYDTAHPRNDSRLNTGLRELPPLIPALIWYGSDDSPEFPALGNGGRSAVAGPVYAFEPGLASDVKLPAAFHDRFFIADWCRTWIKTVRFAADGSVAAIEPFLGDTLFNRPIDLKFGPDGALYLLEFGAKWAGNTDGVLSRIVYRRGNRPPQAMMSADVVAGTAPLTVRFSARGSRDPDGDRLTYAWQLGEGGAVADGPEATWTYQGQGVRTAALVVTDPQGLSHRTTVSVTVGNAPPVVRVAAPVHGSFADWGEKLPFAISVYDHEDGSTADGAIAAAAVRTLWRYRDEIATGAAAGPQFGFDGAAAIMRRSDCLSCHQLATASVGPAFLQIAERYRGEAGAAERLASRIRDGGAGAWGEVPMPPHPQHSPPELAAMAAYVLGLQPPAEGDVIAGLRGELATLPGPRNPMHEKNAGGSYLLTASYRDRGAPGVPALTAEARIVVHARRRRAALFDASVGVTVMEVSTMPPRRDRRVCAQLAAGGHLVIRDVNLAGIGRVACEVSAGAGHGGTLELRADGPAGPLLGTVAVPETGRWEDWITVVTDVRDPGRVVDLFVVHRAEPGRTERRFNLDVLEFKPSGRPAEPRS